MDRDIGYIQNILKKGNYSKALREIKKILKKKPKNVDALNLKGLSLQGLNEIEESIKYFKEALLVDENYIPVLNNLAISHKSLGDIDLARKAYEKIILLNDKYLPALNNLAFIEQEYNNHNKAIKLFNKILNLNNRDEKIPLDNQISAMYQLGKIKSEQGNFKEAHDYFNKILKINPKNISTHGRLATIITYSKNNQDSLKHIKEMTDLTKDQNLKAEEKVILFISIGKAFEDNKNYEKAFFYYNKANFLKNKNFTNYNFGQEEELFKNLKSFFSDIDFTQVKVNDFEKKVIFVCGLPRSGTTLTEQILASHNNVTMTGELNYLTEAMHKYIIITPPNINKKLIDKLLLNNKVQDYYKKLLNNYKVKSTHVIDKAPLNFKWIGFIKFFFPNAKIIHVSRNAQDNCLSLYKNNFKSKTLAWAYTQKNIANYYNLYFDLMKFWEKKLPNFIYNFKYENVINDKENEIRKLLNFCNLNWDTKCLNHQDNKNLTVKTASLSQVRKPIYSSSINSNKRYSKNLQEMFSLIKKNNI